MPRITVLLSGGGRSLANLIERRDAGELACDFARVISSRAGAGGIDVARRHGIPVDVVDRRAHASVEAFSAALTDAIDVDAPELVVMAGFLSFYRLPEHLSGQVINIHPSLLPLFGGKGYYGDRVHAAVLASGMRVTGCTVHFVDDQYDHGPIIAQRPVPVAPSDDVASLSARVFREECQVLPRVVGWHLAGQVRQSGRTVVYGAEAAAEVEALARAAENPGSAGEA